MGLAHRYEQLVQLCSPIIHLSKQIQAHPRISWVGQKDGRTLTFAVDGHSTICALADVQKAPRDDVTRCAAVWEEKLVVVEACVSEAFGIVDFLVQTDDSGHVVFSEVREVSLRGMQRVTCRKQNDNRW